MLYPVVIDKADSVNSKMLIIVVTKYSEVSFRSVFFRNDNVRGIPKFRFLSFRLVSFVPFRLRFVCVPFAFRLRFVCV